MPTSKSSINSKEEKTAAVIIIIAVASVLAVIISAAVLFALRNGGFSFGDKAVFEAAESYLAGLDEEGSCAVFTDGSRLYINPLPSSDEARLIYDALVADWSAELAEVSRSGKAASAEVSISCPDLSSLSSSVAAAFSEKLSARVSLAESSSEIYDSDYSFLPAVLQECFEEALGECLAELGSAELTASLLLEKNGGWQISNPASPVDFLDEYASALFDELCSRAEYIPLSYSIEEAALVAPAPDQALFVSSSDPSQIASLLESVLARSLIGEQELLWNPDIEFIPGSEISCYLDESILMLQWQEKEAGMVGTFAEVFISDGSQIRKKIAGDSFGDMNFQTCSSFASDVNAVLAVGGDFYNHGRNCGIVVQNRCIYRFDPVTCDVCYIDSSGDMLFSYRNQFTELSQAQSFVEENNIVFSLSFGPVLIDNGTDVTPSSYAWGEINDTYARSALGMLGERHYLTMNLNCGSGEYYGYATLRQAADAMIKRGCVKAYTLDGGQTATTAVNGVLKNPVQFGWEKAISDILYFATAVPNE